MITAVMKVFLSIILSLIFTGSLLANEYSNNAQLVATITKSAIHGNVYVYNLSNAKLHTHNCEWAEKCTKNCIYLDKHQLENMFYVPCMVCGGGVIEPQNPHEE